MVRVTVKYSKQGIEMGVEGMARTQNGVSSLTYALAVLFALSLSVGAVGVQARADAEAAPPSGEESVQNDYHSTLESSYDSTIDSVNTCPCSVPLTNSAQISRFLLTNLSVWDGEQMRALGDDCVQSTDNESNEVCLILNLTSAYPEAGMLLIPIDKMNSYLPDLAIRDTELQIRGLEGNSYLLLDLSESADGISLTFSSFSLHKEERWFSFGSNETIRLLERPMLVSLQSVPGDVEVRTQSYDASNTSTSSETLQRIDELRILFESSNSSGQQVAFNRNWLRTYGIENPRFILESGEILEFEYDGKGFVVSVPHFSVVVIREDFQSSYDGFSFSLSGGGSHLYYGICARDEVKAFSLTKSIHEGYTGGNADGTDTIVSQATKSYSLPNIESLSVWFYVSYFQHNGGYWDYLKAGVRFILKNSQGGEVAKYEYWLSSWRQTQNYMDISDPNHEKRVYSGAPPVGTWVKFLTHPDQDWSGIPWSSASSITVELWVHGSGTYGDRFEIHFDDLMISTDTCHSTYVFKGAVDIGMDSQVFSYEVPTTTWCLSASMTWTRLPSNPSGACEVDVSFWDYQGRRTGGQTSADPYGRTDIPYSSRGALTQNPEWMYVSWVEVNNAGMWKTMVYCYSSSAVGASFEIRIDLYTTDSVSQGGESDWTSFNVPSNSYEIKAQLDDSAAVNFDLSMLDSMLRRTGGRAQGEPSSSYEIFNSAYSGYTANPEWVDVVPARANEDTWHTFCYAYSGSGYYHLTVTVEIDTDCDGVRDSLDIDPVHDLCARLTVTKLTTKTNMESGNWDPYVFFGVGTSIPAKTIIGSTGDAWEANLFSRSKEPLALNRDYDGSYVMWKNVPDDSATVPLLMQVWDDDGDSGDDIADISITPGGADEDHQNGSTLHLTYNLLTQTWSGDDSDGVASGLEDDFATQDDAEIRFSVTTAYELPYKGKFRLSERFSPIMYFDATEVYHPIEIRAMLDQSDLRLNSNNNLAYQHPISESALTTYRTTTYMDQIGLNQAGYRNLIYSHVSTSDNDALIVQYWFFYLRDVAGEWHEGDWEMIELVFGDNTRYSSIETINPSFAVYSQHYIAKKKPWLDPGIQKEGDHPKVFVEKGSHASLFSGTQNDRWEYPYDFGIAVTYPNPWMNFAGKWGSDPDSPGDCVPGPVHRVAFNLKDDPRMWHEPRYFLDKAQT